MNFQAIVVAILGLVALDSNAQVALNGDVMRQIDDMRSHPAAPTAPKPNGLYEIDLLVLQTSTYRVRVGEVIAGITGDVRWSVVGKPRADLFFSLGLSLDGIPCGVDESVHGGANNVRAISEAAPYVAAYRTTKRRLRRCDTAAQCHPAGLWS